MVRDLDPYAKRRVQAILRRCGRGQDTDLRILSDGEDGLRGVVGTWFGKKCEHRLDWFHVARRIARIEKEFLYLPYGDDLSVKYLRPRFPGTPRGSLGKLEQHEVDAVERRCGHGGIRNDQSANWSLSARLGTPRGKQ